MKIAIVLLLMTAAAFVFSVPVEPGAHHVCVIQRSSLYARRLELAFHGRGWKDLFPPYPDRTVAQRGVVRAGSDRQRSR